MTIPKEKLLESTPRVKQGLDPSSLNLSAKEAFLISRISGSNKVKEILNLSSMGAEETLSTILSLAIREIIEFKEFGLEELKGKPSTAPKSQKAPPSDSKKTASPSAQKETPAQPPPAPPEPQPQPEAQPAQPQSPPQTEAPQAPPSEAQAPPKKAKGPKLATPIRKVPEVQEDFSDLALQGKFSETPFPELLGKLLNDKESGILRVKRGGGERYKDIYIRSGYPIYVTGNYIIEKECLGQLLKMAGKITQYDLDRSLELVKEGKFQGEAMIELGVINRKMLESALKWQSELKIAEVFAWKEGEGRFEFYRTGSFVRDFIPIQIPVGSLILKGVKRGFPLSVVQERVGKRKKEYVIKRTQTELSPSDFKFQLPEERLFEKVIDGNSTLEEVIENSQMDPKHVQQFIYAMIAAGLMDIRDKPSAGTNEDKIIEDLKERLSVAEKSSYFDALGIHWTSVGWKIDQALQKVEKEYGPNSKYQKSGVQEIAELAKKILQKAKEAHSVLINTDKRVEYRKSIIHETKLQMSADLQYKQAESQLLLKEQYKDGLEILESAAEIAPRNWTVQAAYAYALAKVNYPGNSEKVREGEKILQKALNAANSSDMVHLWAGHMNWAMHRNSSARSEFETALRINPNNTDARKALRAMSKG